MALILSLIIATLIAVAAAKVGFYQIWAVLINLVISVYLSLNLYPYVADLVGAGDGLTGQVLTIFLSALGIFVVLYGICYVFMLGEFNITFPKVLDTVGAGVLGFFGGLFLSAFFGLLICISPLANSPVMKTFGCDASTIQESSLGSYFNWWCGRMDAILVPDAEPATVQTITELTDEAHKELAARKPRATSVAPGSQGAEEPNKPAGPAEKPSELAP